MEPSTKLPGIEAVAQRIENARQGFISICVDSHGFTEEQAKHILAVYRRLKVIKLDTGVGRYQFTHGVYYERQTMGNALNQPTTLQRKRT